MEYSGTWAQIWTQKGLMPGTKEDIRIYDGWEKSSSDMKEVANKIKENLELLDEETILEVGCGAGGLGRYFDDNYTGIDFSKPLVEKCIEFWQKNAIYAEACNLPFEDNTFDKSFSWGVFLYFPDKDYFRKVIDEMKRCTKSKIFIGDLPIRSHNERHLYYSKKEFEDLGFKILDGWTEPYGKDRFNAVYFGDTI